MRVRKVPMIRHPYVMSDLTLAKKSMEEEEEEEEDQMMTDNKSNGAITSTKLVDNEANELCEELRHIVAKDRDLYERVS
jgi:hypothetical protein